MSKLYLITGFLGAGKTTFLKRFIRFFPGQKIQLIINEFGKEGVDGILLQEMNALLHEISGGSVFCSCRMDQFEKILTETAELQPDVIVVEASGLSDPTGVRKLFQQSGRFPHIDYQGALCLVDGVRFPKIYATVRTALKQLAASDVALINKADLATHAQMAETLALIRGQRPEMPLLQISHGAAPEDLMEILARASELPGEDMPLTADLTLKKALIRLRPGIPAYDLEKLIEMFLEVTFRVKGFAETQEGLQLVDCVGNVVNCRPFQGDVPPEKRNFLVALAGAGMNLRSRVKEAAAWYPGWVESFE